MGNFETPQDRKRAGVAAVRWARAVSGSANHLHECKSYYDFDFYETDGEGDVVAFIEVKVRKNKMNLYPTLMISYKKVVNMLLLAEMAGPFANSVDNIQVVLLVQWEDALGDVRIRRSDIERSIYRVQHGGRTPREGASEWEPCLYIPIDAFSIVPEKL
jgi:hypothetical protein